MKADNEYFYSVYIRISGAGRTLEHEKQIIKKALETRGYTIKLIDEFPFEGSEEELETYMKRMDDKLKEKDGGQGIILEIEHLPWGG